MRKYPEKYLEVLKNEVMEIENNGLKIILKPSPGEKREGYLDPCEKLIMEGHWASKTSSDKEVIEEKENLDTESKGQAPSSDMIISMIRDSMGFANYNLNTVEIYTKFETITDSGNEVGLWRYYPRHIEKFKDRPALVFIHGGGWIGGTTYVVENFCKLIAEKANCVVFNIDYSLAPEKPYPNGLNDNYYAVKHIYDNADKYRIDKNKIAVAGDSAGGNYTAAISLRARDKEVPMIALQVLIYPAVAIGDASVPGYKWSEDMIKISQELEEKVRPLTGLGRPSKDFSDPILSSYLSSFDLVNDPYVSPMVAKSHRNLPKAILIGAEFDGLRIQTEFYAKQLQDAGVDVTCYRYKGMTHAFIDKLGFVPQAEDLANIISDAIKNL
ncbi:alpha/beta hydrolase [Paraclostridium bifermentans]|uniref:alpha/beta hydrolase n=1 Tax=Paraclostridium bifermentans TaxID=1490 RepID=UPI0018A08D7D|nr:alpha/beta hydrolase [Paraclostridium bifermentans]